MTAPDTPDRIAEIREKHERAEYHHAESYQIDTADVRYLLDLVNEPEWPASDRRGSDLGTDSGAPGPDEPDMLSRPGRDTPWTPERVRALLDDLEPDGRWQVVDGAVFDHDGQRICAPAAPGDRALIAAAPDALRYLLGELERVRGALEAWLAAEHALTAGEGATTGDDVRVGELVKAYEDAEERLQALAGREVE